VTIEVDRKILGCVPRRLADWRAGENGTVVVERPKPPTRGLRGTWDRLQWFIAHPRIRLDELGGEVWRRIDGEMTLAEIAAATTELFPDRAEQMDERIALFATALQHQGLIELRLAQRV
jgi:hypothetical protein